MNGRIYYEPLLDLSRTTTAGKRRILARKGRESNGGKVTYVQLLHNEQRKKSWRSICVNKIRDWAILERHTRCTDHRLKSCKLFNRRCR